MPAIPPNPTRWCMQCSYPLNAVTDNKCPECGKPFDPDDRSTFVTDLEEHKIRKIFPWVIAGIMAILFALSRAGDIWPFMKEPIKETLIALLIVGPACVITFLFVRRQFNKKQ